MSSGVQSDRLTYNGNKVPVPKNSCYFGATVNEGKLNPKWADRFAAPLNRYPRIATIYINLGKGPQAFPKEQCDVIHKMGAIPLIMVQTEMIKDDKPYPLDGIITGKHDALLSGWSAGAKDLGYSFYISFNHEMDGNWYCSSGAKNGGGKTKGFGDPRAADGPERFVAAYKRFHDIFTAAAPDSGATWVLCFNELSAPVAPWNVPANYIPGSGYFDWLGMNGYNWGRETGWSQWRTFDQIFGKRYGYLTRKYPDKPLIICEFSSSEKGGDKAGWIADAFQAISERYKSIKGACWFNLYREGEEIDWSYGSSENSLNAFRSSVSNHFMCSKTRLGIFGPKMSWKKEAVLIDDFEYRTDMDAGSADDWWSYGGMRHKIIGLNNEHGNVLALSSGSGTGFIGGCGTYLGVNAVDHDQIEMDVKGKGTVKFELYDDDPSSGATVRSDRSFYGDIFVFKKKVREPEWNHVTIPLASFMDANPDVGNDFYDPNQQSQNMGLVKMQISAEDGAVDLQIDNIKMSNRTARK